MRSSRHVSAVLGTSQCGLFRKLLFLGALNVGAADVSCMTSRLEVIRAHKTKGSRGLQSQSLGERASVII
jgi:hypothetical protein